MPSQDTKRRPSADIDPLVQRLRAGETTVWLRSRPEAPPDSPLTHGEIDEACARFERFAPALAALFPQQAWDGRICSPLVPYRPEGLAPLLVKCDHALPMTGSVKARGGVFEVLTGIERIALDQQLIDGSDWTRLLTAHARARLSEHAIVVASTGNLGFSIGLVARAFGLTAEVHMSYDAKAWKKDRLRRIGARVVEHPCDYTETVERARSSAALQGAYFVDDETSRLLFLGYAAAARELAGQLSALGLSPSPDRPLCLYFPCGVGGAPGGVTAGLAREYGAQTLRPVFVEPTASPCMLLALACGQSEPVAVYDFGLDNRTIADGLAVARVSPLVLETTGPLIDAAIAVPDESMRAWTRRAWADASLRLEPSGAAGFAAVGAYADARRLHGEDLAGAIHVVWTTGGGLLPDAEFQALLED